MTRTFDDDVEAWVLRYLVSLGLTYEEAKRVDWRKARDKCREEQGEARLNSIKPYLVAVAGEGLK